MNLKSVTHSKLSFKQRPAPQLRRYFYAHFPSKKGSSTMKPILKTLAIVTATVLATAYLTYRTTMQNIQVEVARDTVYLTVFGQTDEYVIGE
jgi:hypothetical protein